MHPSSDSADLIADCRRSEAEAARKKGLIKVLVKKVPEPIQAGIETGAKAVKRQDPYARRLQALGLKRGAD